MNRLLSNYKIYLLALLVLLVACGPRGREESIRLNQDSVSDSLRQVFNAHELMGMAVVLMEDGEMIYSKGFGWADSARGILVTPDTRFRIASISKTFTAVAVMQLVEQGKLDLNQDVSTYLGWSLKHPAYPDIPITLAMLMSHTSGIRDGSGYARFLEDMVAKKLNISELFMEEGAYFTPDMYDAHAPGKYFSYTNCTWGLIASIVESASNQRFDRYCNEYLFKPLEISPGFLVKNLEDLDQLAVLYRFIDGAWVPQADHYQDRQPPELVYPGYRPGRNGLLFGPQGSLRISAHELGRFAQMMFNQGKWDGYQVLQPESLETMLSSHWIYNGNNGDTWDNFFLSYGYGTHQLTNRDSSDIVFPDRQMVGHPGIAYGLLSDFYLDPETGSGVIFITNGSKQEYQYGEETSFYQVEEDVFKVLYRYISR